MNTEWSGVSRSADEDIELTSIIKDYRLLTPVRTAAFLLMSAVILGAYLFMNHSFFPWYPITTPYAEENSNFARQYPPFRLHEQISYSITKDIISGNLNSEDSYAHRHPPGFSLLSVPLTMAWDKAGPFYTNAVILWFSAIFFFFLMLEMVPFSMALCSTLILAFASPNLFFAASSYPEPTTQLFTVISLLVFVKGLSTGQELLYYALAGFTVGLTLFVQPSMAILFILFTAVLLYEHGRWAFSDWSIYLLTGGFLIPFIVFLVANKMLSDSYTGHIYSAHYALGSLVPQGGESTSANVLTDLKKLLFDYPHGLFFLMPLLVFVPHGFSIMWRYQIKPVFFVSVSVILGLLLLTAVSIDVVTDETIGSRHLIGIIPLLIIPLAFVWDEYRYGKILVISAFLATVYLSTFGWWAGNSKGNNIFFGMLHDRNARTILKTRNGSLEKTVITSANDTVDRFFQSLEKGDIKTWLMVLDNETMMKIQGKERAVFMELTAKYNDSGYDNSRLVQSIDPDNGIRLFISDIQAIE